MNRFFVRTATAGDLPAISALLVETWHATYDGIYGRARVIEITAAWHGVETLRPRLDRPGSEFLVADDGQTLAGMAFAALAQREGKRDCVILHQLYVRPDHQRQGIGGELFAEVETCFFEARRLRVEVEQANSGALAFYRHVGFSPVGEADTAERIEGVDTLVLEKALAHG